MLTHLILYLYGEPSDAGDGIGHNGAPGLKCQCGNKHRKNNEYESLSNAAKYMRLKGRNISECRHSHSAVYSIPSEPLLDGIHTSGCAVHTRGVLTA